MKRKIIAMIPARVGSERLKMKNLALINDKPMIYYAIQAAIESKIFDNIILNSDSKIFEKIARRYNIDFYLRPLFLGSSETKSDDVIADFMKPYSANDIIVWINSINPFQKGENINKIVKYFLNNYLDSLITVENRQVHTNFRNQPLNYKIGEIFSKTQDIEPIQPFVYSIMMWRVGSFLAHYKKDGFAIFSGKFGVYPVRGLVTITIKTKNDLLFADKIMRGLNNNKEIDKLKYDEIVK